MGIKLILVLLLVGMCYSCATKKRKMDIGSTEEEYIVAYKKSVLMGCLNEITNNEFGKSLYSKYNDIGLYTEVAIIYHSGVENAEQIGSTYAKTLQPVDYPDVEGRIQGYSACVDFAFYNQKIDSIARIRYKKLSNSKLEYTYD